MSQPDTNPPSDPSINLPQGAISKMKIGDLPNTEITEVDKKMWLVYGDKVHMNDGTHLDGGYKMTRRCKKCGRNSSSYHRTTTTSREAPLADKSVNC